MAEAEIASRLKFEGSKLPFSFNQNGSSFLPVISCSVWQRLGPLSLAHEPIYWAGALNCQFRRNKILPNYLYIRIPIPKYYYFFKFVLEI